MSISLVDTAIAESVKGGNTTLTPTLVSAATASNLLVLAFSVDSQTNPTSIDDGTWNTAQTNDYDGTHRMRVYWKVAVGGEGPDIGITWDSAVQGSAYAAEYSGTAASSPLSGTPATSTGNGTAPEAGADGGAANEFLHVCLVGLAHSGASFSSPTESFVIEEQGGGGNKGCYMDLIQPSAPASQTPGCTSSQTGDWGTIHAMFLQASSFGAAFHHYRQQMGA